MKKCMGCMSEYDEQLTVCPICGYSDDVSREQAKQVPDALPAETILQGRFIVGRILGINHFSILYIAWDALLLRRVVIRELFPFDFCVRDGLNLVARTGPGQEVFAQLINRFEREILTLSACQDLPFVLDYYRTFYENQTVYAYTEYIEGNTLEDLYPLGTKIEAEEGFRFISMLGSYLSTLNERKVIHGNISPSSIYICSDRSMKLIDLKKKKRWFCSYLKSESDILRTEYCAPEILSHNVTGAVDLYSVGAVYYRLLTGKEPPAKNRRSLRVKDKMSSDIVAVLTAPRPDERMSFYSRYGESSIQGDGYGSKYQRKLF